MWKDKGLQLVILPTNDKASIGMLCVGNIDGKLRQHTDIVSWHGVNQCLYLLSDEEIKVGDWMFAANTNEIEQCKGIPNGDKEWWLQGIKKIIAITNPSINLPQFPSSFLEEYVKRYNSKKSLEVEVEYRRATYDDWMANGAQPIKKELIVISNNTISIRFKEEKMYSRSEVVELCSKAFSAGEAYRTGSCEGFNQIHLDKHDWLKENLK